MKIYVVLIDDRHTDTEPYVFSTPEAAIEYARTQAHKYALDPADVEEEQISGWLYYARYSPESDRVWVVEKTIDSVEG